jgi:hypothetical protein
MALPVARSPGRAHLAFLGGKENHRNEETTDDLDAIFL